MTPAKVILIDLRLVQLCKGKRHSEEGEGEEEEEESEVKVERNEPFFTLTLLNRARRVSKVTVRTSEAATPIKIAANGVTGVSSARKNKWQ